MTQVLGIDFGNPSSVHSFGREARVLLEDARETVANCINAGTAEVFFTSGGTEADNIAVIGGMEANRDRGNHLIVSMYEHHAVLDTAEYLEKNGYEVTYVKPDEFGIITPEAVAEAIRPDTVLISIMHVNNEVGTINPIAEIGQLAREREILFHTDAVQSFCKVKVDVEALNVDMLSVSGHKIYGPKGIGALYARKGVRVNSRTFGGHQERDVRTGTENIAGIVGLAKAAEIGQQEMASEAQRLTPLRDRLLNELNATLPEIRLNGHPEKRIPGVCNISFEGIEGEALLLSLDMKGIAASTGSACSSGSTSASHVLLAMGIPPEIAQASIRFSMGRENDEESIDYVLNIMPELVTNLRRMGFNS